MCGAPGPAWPRGGGSSAPGPARPGGEGGGSGPAEPGPCSTSASFVLALPFVGAMWRLGEGRRAGLLPSHAVKWKGICLSRVFFVLSLFSERGGWKELLSVGGGGAGGNFVRIAWPIATGVDVNVNVFYVKAHKEIILALEGSGRELSIF